METQKNCCQSLFSRNITVYANKILPTHWAQQDLNKDNTNKHAKLYIRKRQWNISSALRTTRNWVKLGAGEVVFPGGAWQLAVQSQMFSLRASNIVWNQEVIFMSIYGYINTYVHVITESRERCLGVERGRGGATVPFSCSLAFFLCTWDIRDTTKWWLWSALPASETIQQASTAKEKAEEGW